MRGFQSSGECFSEAVEARIFFKWEFSFLFNLMPPGGKCFKKNTNIKFISVLLLLRDFFFLQNWSCSSHLCSVKISELHLPWQIIRICWAPSSFFESTECRVLILGCTYLWPGMGATKIVWYLCQATSNQFNIFYAQTTGWKGCFQTNMTWAFCSSQLQTFFPKTVGQPYQAAWGVQLPARARNWNPSVCQSTCVIKTSCARGILQQS